MPAAPSADEILIRAALRDEMSRPISEIRQELGQLRLALNVVANDGRRTANSLEAMRTELGQLRLALNVVAHDSRRAANSLEEMREVLGQMRLALNVVAHDGRRAADSLERMERAGRTNVIVMRANASATRSAARSLSDYARQAGQAARATARLTGAVLGLNAALRGGRGLINGIRGVQGETKLLIAVFATLIPAAVPVFSVLTAGVLSTGGAVGALVGSLGVLVLALSGVGDAVGALASGDMDKINESFAKLTDTGREFATYVVSLRPVLDQLRGAAQVATLPGLQQALGIMVTTLPAVTDLVVALGQATGGAAVQLADAFAGPGGQAFVQFLISQAPAINQFTSGLISLTGSLSLLLQAFSPLAAVTNAALGGVLDNFRAFSDGTTGRLQQFIGYVEQAMGPVGDFLTGFGTTLLDLLEALGQPGLVVLGAVNDLLGLLSTLAPLVGDIAQAIGIGLSGVFRALIPIVEQLAPVLGQVLIQATEGVAAALIALAPTIGQIATFFADELLVGVQQLIPFLQPLGTAFLGVLQALLPLVPILLSLIPIVGTTLLQVFAALTPAIAELAPVIGQLAADLLTGLLPVLPLAAQLLAGIVTALTPLLPMLGDVLVQALGAIIPELPALVDAFLQLLDALIPLVPTLLPLVVDLLPLLPPILQLSVTATLALVEGVRFLMPFIQSLAAELGVILPPIVELLTGTIGDLDAQLRQVGEWLGIAADYWTQWLEPVTSGNLLNNAKEALGGLVDVLKEAWNWVGKLVDKITGNSVVSKILGGARTVSENAGDTGVPIAPSLIGAGPAVTMGAVGGALGGTLAMHSALAGGSRIAVTNMLTGGGGRGPGSGDHQRGRALDLVGPGLSGYAAKLTAMGGYAAFHGSGPGRHLHAVYPAYPVLTRPSGPARASVARTPIPAMLRPGGGYGDTSVSMAGGLAAAAFAGPVQITMPVYVTNPTSNVDVAGAVQAGTRAAIEEYRRDLAERRSPGAF